MKAHRLRCIMCGVPVGPSPWGVSHSEIGGYRVHLCPEHAVQAANTEAAHQSKPARAGGRS